MPDAAEPFPPSPRVTANDAPFLQVPVPLLAVPVFGDAGADPLDDLPGLDDATNGAIRRMRAAGEFRAARRKTALCDLAAPVSPAAPAPRVLLVGAPPAAGRLTDRIREAAAVASRTARARRIDRLTFVCRSDGPAADLSPAEAAALGRAAAEGLVLGGWIDTRYKRDADGDAGPPAGDVIWAPAARETAAAGGGAAAVQRGAACAAAANLARALANAPANRLPPAVFAERAAAEVGQAGVTTEVLDEAAIRGLGMGLLLGVAAGAAAPPRLLVMRHEPADAPERPVLGLVGKGVTFDSGGISIKPAAGMEWMKSDMAGGAAVVGAMHAIGTLGIPHRVIGIVPMTENMPGGAATRPGDILTGADGTTVEVINTDAEGRLILGDAIWHARQCGATHLVDVATLTGACVVALGGAASGLFARPDPWAKAMQTAAARAGERVWPLPLYPEYREQLRSELADLKNIGGREAGACTAASFIDAFTGGLPWAHLDIAGTAWLDKPRADAAAGATGVMVRTLVDLAADAGSW